MSGAPRIGVTNWSDVAPEALERYWARVRDAGGEVVDLAEAAAGRGDDLAPSLDALMLTGGIDVDPATYGAARHAKVKETSPERDAMELEFLDRALRRDIPVLAICRGHQIMNVGFGGALLQHIDSGQHRADFATPGYPSRWHSVHLSEDSRLVAAYGASDFVVNSRHHQAVTMEHLGAGLRPTAFADDPGGELVEGCESEQHRWVVSVQWHPERPEAHEAAFAPMMRRLFDAFVAEARKVRA
jgi:putative glutamine amidotransferase